MAALRESSLVNFRALQDEVSPDKGSELLRNVTALLGLVSDQCGQHLLDVYDSVMVRLIDMVDVAMKAEVAAQLSQLRHAPAAVVRKLAMDDIEIAQPLLIRSQSLTDDDLIGIAEIRGTPHRRAIATRPGISVAVTAVILKRADDAVRRVLASNVTAKLPDGGFQRFLDQAKHDTEMQALIAGHPATPVSVLQTLVKFSTEEVITRVKQRTQTTPQHQLERPRATSLSKLFAGYDFPAATEKVKRRMARGPFDMETVSRLVAGDGFAEGVVAFSKLANFPLREVLCWFALCDIEMVTVAARVLGATDEDFSRLMMAPPWRFRISAEERAEALEEFGELDLESANRQLAERQNEQAA